MTDMTADESGDVADLIVVGGVLAGLRTADLALAEGRTVTVLEALDRIGGRAWTTDSFGPSMDLGAGWHDDSHTEFIELVDRFGLTRSRPQHEGRALLRVGGRVVDDPPWASVLEDLSEMSTRLDRLVGTDADTDPDPDRSRFAGSSIGATSTSSRN